MNASVTVLCLMLGQAASYPREQLLVETKNLENLGSSKNVRVLDARSLEKYKMGHLPQAVWVDHETWSKTFGAHQDSKAWLELIAPLGIRDDSIVVVYDDALSKDAARIWWILRYWGVNDVRILNGGWKAYLDAKLPITAIVPTVGQSSLSIRDPLTARFADKGKVLDLLKVPGVQIVDARSEKEHCGETVLSKKGGAIPGAIHLEWTEALDPESQKFKSPTELTRILKAKGIDLTKPLVTHCQSGGRTAVMFFTLELMGAAEVANYYRGWSEWGNAEDAPIANPKKKQGEVHG